MCIFDSIRRRLVQQRRLVINSMNIAEAILHPVQVCGRPQSTPEAEVHRRDLARTVCILQSAETPCAFMGGGPAAMCRDTFVRHLAWQCDPQHDPGRGAAHRKRATLVTVFLGRFWQLFRPAVAIR